MEGDQGDIEHQLVIMKEENVEYVGKDDSNNVKTETLLVDDVNSIENTDESVSYKIKRDHLSPSPAPLQEEEKSEFSQLSTSQCEGKDIKMDTSNHQQEQLDAAYSLIQVTEVASSTTALPSSDPRTCILSSTLSDPHNPMSPPTTQSENSSIISSGSSTESDHEMSIVMLDGKRSSSVSSDMAQHDPVSPRKRNAGHDSGLDNGSEESDCPDTKRMATEHLDFSIDMSKYNNFIDNCYCIHVHSFLCYSCFL